MWGVVLGKAFKKDEKHEIVTHFPLYRFRLGLVFLLLLFLLIECQPDLDCCVIGLKNQA